LELRTFHLQWPRVVIITAAKSDGFSNFGCHLPVKVGHSALRLQEPLLQACWQHILTVSRTIIVKIWILAGGVLALIAAHAAYTFRHRRTGPRFTKDQVSRDWLATARIHEDQGW
jgi:hypothetical protein